jgi:peroxiredoxin
MPAMNRALCCLLWLPAAVWAADAKDAKKDEPPAKAEIGKAVREFKLADTVTGKEVSLSGLKGKVVVVVFYSHTCGTCPLYDGRFRKFSMEAGSHGVEVLAIDSAADRAAADAGKAWQPKRMGFPLLKDDRTKTAKWFEAECTPTCYLIDAKGVLRYAGAFDDSDKEDEVKVRHLQDAVDAVLAGKPVKTEKTDAFG